MERAVKYIIVGQGIAGTLLSWHFQKRNIEHIVVSSEKKKSASLVAAGMFNPLVFKRISKSWKVDELLPVMFDTYRELGAELDKEVIHNLPIAKLIREEEKDWWTERVNSQELFEYFGGFSKNRVQGIKNEFGFVKVNNSGYVDLKQLIHFYREKLILQGNFIGAELHSKDVTISAEGIQWKNIKAEKIIFCDGVHNIENSFFPEVKFYPTRGDILEVKIEGLTEQYIINKDVFLLPRGNE